VKKISEAELQSMFISDSKKALPEFIVIPHRNPSEAGTPDLSITGCGRTSWWELKVARPSIRSRGVQDIMLARLHTRGLARYLIFSEQDNLKQTHMVTPERVADGTWREFGVPGWNFGAVFDYIRSLHV
jgi:hypothetical protein